MVGQPTFWELLRLLSVHSNDMSFQIVAAAAAAVV